MPRLCFLCGVVAPSTGSGKALNLSRKSETDVLGSVTRERRVVHEFAGGSEASGCEAVVFAGSLNDTSGTRALPDPLPRQ